MKQSRRNILKGSGVVAAAAASAAATAGGAQAQAKLEKRSPYPPPATPPATKPMFSSATAYGNLLFLAGVGYHQPGTIEEHTRHVIEELEQNLIRAGSSLQKVLKVSVFLNDLKDYDRMNAVYRTFDWGDVPAVRTTVSPAGGIPGNSLIEIDMIAYI